MVSQMAAVLFVVAAMVASVTAQRSPYAGASDPGVLPQYRPADDGNRFGDSNPGTPPPKIHEGTLETEALYNRVQGWPDNKKPFWYLNSVALNKQRQQQQQQQAQQQEAQTQNPQAPFAASARKNFRRQNSQ